MRIVGILVLAVSLISCGGETEQVSTEVVNNPNSAGTEANQDVPTMEFSEPLYDFGDIAQGDRVNYNFTFTNNGTSDLVIASAKGSCGCTVPDWPKRPIKPGETSEIKVEFNSTGKKGKQHKKVTIVANTQPSKNVIAIQGNVIAPVSE
ncbi:MAG TPA: hypothetical protein DCS15_02640 [Flavobacteriales bacterium]|jgi:hypothetical protein|nr:hypothetical protein [Flavobacteriales bacterium]